MATLTITKSYLDGTLLTEAQLDSFCDSMETFFNVTKINDDNILNGGITASDKVITGSVDGDCLGALSITQAKFADGSVTASKIDSVAATNAKFASGSITTAKITDAVITEDLVEASVFDTTDTAAGGQAGSGAIAPIEVNATPTLTGSRAGISGFVGNTDATDTQNATGTLSLTSGATGGYLVLGAGVTTASSSLTEEISEAGLIMITGCSTSYSAEWEIPVACPFLLSSTNSAGAATVTLTPYLFLNQQVGTGGTATTSSREANGKAFYYEF